MDVHKSKKEQWDKNYISKSFVTNSPLEAIFRYHQLEVPTNKLILDIGVGQGDFIKNLSQYNTMIGADVSENALNVVKSYCKNIYFSEKLDEIESVDLAICHLVMQHNHEYEVARIIDDVNIKDDGMFSFQFASLNVDKVYPTRLIMNEINNSMLYFYSLKKMTSIIDSTNKKIVNTIGPIWFGDPYNFEWFIFQVVNK